MFPDPKPSRLTEPSTWAGLAAFATFFGPQFADPGIQSAIVAVGVAASSVLSVILREKKGHD